ncbi:MAG: hypothetical protein J5I98_09190 [Phaeodactylibacter sp.]|nr:hypothetical protein [Phaeodactylibacter sp.]
MSANFSNLRLRFQHIYEDGSSLNFDTDFNLSSINFDLNQTAIMADTRFTSDMSFILKIEKNDSYSDLNELVEWVKGHYQLAGDLSPEAVITNMLKIVFDPIFGQYNPTPELPRNIPFQIRFLDNSEVNPNPEEVPLARQVANVKKTAVTSIATNKTDLFSLSWFIQLKFQNGEGEGIESGIYFPQLFLPNNSNYEVSQSGQLPLPLLEGIFSELENDNTLQLFNNELRFNYELLVSALDNRTGRGEDVIGKAAEELVDSINNLSSSLGRNLSGTLKTQLQPVGAACTPDLALWVKIKKGTEDLSFNRFQDFMDAIFCGGGSGTSDAQNNKAKKLDNRRSLPFMNVDAYRSVKIAAEAFVMANCAVDRPFTKEDVEDFELRGPVKECIVDEAKLEEFWNDYRVRAIGVEEPVIPYLEIIRNKMRDEGIKTTSFADAFDSYLENNDEAAKTCYGLIQEKLTHPCFLELIWSYWHEESMMVQGLNAIFRRFQNIKNPGGKDPLVNLAIDPLRPLSNLIWGFVQDEQNRLTVKRRAYEYANHYGISLHGNAAKGLNFADFRTNFLEAFHRLLHITSKFYKQADDMTVNPDAFPVLNGLKEVHLILSEGAHNQFGELPSVARAEMLMQQWLLARSELREFLPTRLMVAYPEPWMDRVAALNNLMGWTPSSPLHFKSLGSFGEQILLSIRYGNWSEINIRDFAANWAHFWREQIQGYIHAYHAVTGVDLTATLVGNKIDARPPSYHLARRLKARQNGQLAKPSSNGKTPKKGGVKKEWF